MVTLPSAATRISRVPPSSWTRMGSPALQKPFVTAAAALLHDVMEDTDVTEAELAAQFPERVMDALRLLTHDPAEDYFDYVRRIRENPDAKAVKLADLRHNSDTGRLPPAARTDPKTLERCEKYRQAIKILTDE